MGKGFRAQNKLKKAALTVIATELSEESLKDLKEMFMGLDKDNDGTLTVDEMKKGMIKAGIKEIPDNLMEIMKEVDSDGSGVIDYTEFLAATLSRRQYMQEDIVWSAFRVFDLDGDGQITREELAQVLSGDRVKDVEEALQLNKDEIERIIKEVDEDGDGQISFQEFFNMMKKKEREGDRKKKKKKKKGEEGGEDEEKEDDKDDKQD